MEERNSEVLSWLRNRLKKKYKIPKGQTQAVLDAISDLRWDWRHCNSLEPLYRQALGFRNCNRFSACGEEMNCKNCGGEIPTSQRERTKRDCICTNPAPHSKEYYSVKDQLDRIEGLLIKINQMLTRAPSVGLAPQLLARHYLSKLLGR